MPFIKKLNGDENRYTQILLNFLSNALKFSNQNEHVNVTIRPILGQIFYQKVQNNNIKENLIIVEELKDEED